MFAALVCAGSSFAENVPRPDGRINDFANVISQEYRDKLTGIITELEEKTGAEIAVVTIASIAPHDEKEYARMLFDNWKPGKKGKDNGALILLAVKERRWRIEAGYGVEGILPDGRLGEIGRNYMVPYFKSGDYGKGLYLGALAVAAVIAKDAGLALSVTGEMAGTQAQPEVSASQAMIYLVIIILFLVISYIPAFIKHKTGYYSAGGWGGGFGDGGFGGGGFGGGGGGGGGAGGGF